MKIANRSHQCYSMHPQPLQGHDITFTLTVHRCMVDMRKSYGVIVGNFYGMTMVGVFVANALCYGAIYLKIRQVAQKNTLVESRGEKKDKYHKTARMMMLFVLVYLWQWWTFVVQALWGLVETPHIAIYILGVLIINLGGVYNALAYTFIRKKYSSVGAASEESKSTAHRGEFTSAA